MPAGTVVRSELTIPVGRRLHQMCGHFPRQYLPPAVAAGLGKSCPPVRAAPPSGPPRAELRAGSAQPCHLPQSQIAILIRNCGAGCDCQLQIQSYTRTWFQAGNRSEVNPPEALGESGDNFLHMQKETSNAKLNSSNEFIDVSDTKVET